MSYPIKLSRVGYYDFEMYDAQYRDLYVFAGLVGALGLGTGWVVSILFTSLVQIKRVTLLHERNSSHSKRCTKSKSRLLIALSINRAVL